VLRIRKGFNADPDMIPDFFLFWGGGHFRPLRSKSATLIFMIGIVRVAHIYEIYDQIFSTLKIKDNSSSF
jgi:hypothetical protein